MCLKAIGADATGRIQAAGQRLMVIGPFLDIPRLDFPLADTPTLDLALEWTVDEVPEASHHYIWLTDMTGFPFWMIQADGDVSDVSLPDLSEVGIPAVWPGSGGIRLQRAYAPAFNINDFDFRDMSLSRWRSWTTSVFPVQW